MYVNYAEAVVRQYASDFPDEREPPEEVVRFRTYPVSDDVDAEAVTRDVRRWLLDGRHTHFLFEERRSYADVGAEGSSVEFILSLLGSGAAQVALEEIVSFVKGRLGEGSDEAWRVERFEAAPSEQLRDEALSTAERVLELPRGDLAVIDFERAQQSITVNAQSSSTGQRYRVTLNADETMRVRALSSRRD